MVAMGIGETDVAVLMFVAVMEHGKYAVDISFP